MLITIHGVYTMKSRKFWKNIYKSQIWHVTDIRSMHVELYESVPMSMFT